MAAIIKPIGAEIAAPLLISATDLGGAKVFRVVNTAGAVGKVAITDANDVLVGDITLVAGGTQLFFKSSTDKVSGSAITLLITPLANTKG
jgi:hypothetical protein